MRAARYASLCRELTHTARKVLDAVPINEAWPTHRITAELMRLGTPKDRNILEGCLNSLMKDGLVIERPPGHWMRVPLEPEFAPAPAAKDDIVPLKTAGKAAEPLTPLKRISMLAVRARDLSKSLADFANDIDEAALIIDQEVADMGERTQKLDQLQQLLKGLV